VQGGGGPTVGLSGPTIRLRLALDQTKPVTERIDANAD
jgi:hypothetical protein